MYGVWPRQATPIPLMICQKLFGSLGGRPFYYGDLSIMDEKEWAVEDIQAERVDIPKAPSPSL
jgi:hypothetical protein